MRPICTTLGKPALTRWIIASTLCFVAVGVSQVMGAEFFVSPDGNDAWVDESKTKIGYEISFNRYFHECTPPGPLEEIEAAPKQIKKEIADMQISPDIGKKWRSA